MLGAPAIAAVLVIAWLLPFVLWAIVTVGVASTVIFLLVLVAHHELSLRVLARPGVLAALVMYTIALFTVAYAALELRQPDSIQTDGSGHPGSLGVAALVATSMGIAGGEVGAQVREGARVIAHVQLLLVIGAIAGAGGQVLQRLTGQASDGIPPATRVPTDPVVDLYRRVYDRLTDRGGDAVLEELELGDHENAPMWRDRIRSLPQPDVASPSDAVAVFERIIAGDLEVSYRASFEGQVLGVAVRPYTSFAQERRCAWAPDSVTSDRRCGDAAFG
jgi:hypothetical protein